MENAGTVKLYIARKGCADFDCSVDFKTIEVTAVNGKDFEMTQGTIKFAEGEEEK